VSDIFSHSVTRRSSTQVSLWAVVFFFLMLVSVFHETTWSMISIWIRSETFAHGFLVLPISIWLAWNERDKLASICSRPVPWVALLIIPPGFVWLVAWLVDVLVLQQLALVAMCLIGAWAIMGHSLARALAFPLLFLFFAVPMGEALIPPMMEFTATSTVWMIQQTGIPVYREGLYFMVPSGNWSVVEACSGVRYIIASVTLGVLYAYLTYRSFWRRFLFVLAAAIVPVLANSVRAYLIVMIGHLSDMKLAVGVDHLIYGWIFFGIVIFLLFWIGSFFREGIASSHAPAAGNVDNFEKSFTNYGLVTLWALMVAGIWPLMATIVPQGPVAVNGGDIRLSAVQGYWLKVPDANLGWKPSSVVNGQKSVYYQNSGVTVGLHIQYMMPGSSEGELVGSIDRFVDQTSNWRVVAQTGRSVQLPRRSLSLIEAIVESRGEKRIAWSWYRIAGKNVSNDYLAKFHEALASLGLRPGGSIRIIATTPVVQDPDAGRDLLRVFLQDTLPGLERRLDKPGSGD
jgi:exosortase A